MDTVQIVGDRGEHEFAHHLRMPNDHMQGDASAHAVTKDIGTFDPKVPDRGGDIIRHLFEGHRAVNIRGVPMGLQLEGDDLAGLGQGRQKLSE